MRTQFKFTLRLICTPEYKYTPEYIYTRVFFAHANWTLFFAQNIDCGYTAEAVLTSTHNLCFGAKTRKIGIPLHTPVLQYKSGV